MSQRQINAAGDKVKADHKFLVDGVSRRDDVRAQLGDVQEEIGEPDLFIARWNTSRAYAWAFAQSGQSVDGRLWHTRNLWIEYDPQGVVREHHFLSLQQLEARLDHWYSIHPPPRETEAFSLAGLAWDDTMTEFGPDQIVYSAPKKQKSFTAPREALESVKIGWMPDSRADTPVTLKLRFKKNAIAPFDW